MQILPLLLEIGAYSHHPYQINLNYRLVNTSYYHSETTTAQGVAPPMLDTLVNNQHHFTSVTPMSLYFHEISYYSKPSCPKQSDVYFTSMNCDYRDETMRGVLNGTSASVLRKDSFERLLNFFGFSWDRQDKAKCRDVSMKHIMSFISVLNDRSNGGPIDISTIEGFKAFLQRFHIDYLFAVDETKCITENIRLFGMFMRYYVKVRVGSFEGQHRFVLLALFLQGYLSPSTTVPMEATTLANWEGRKCCDEVTPSMQFQGAQCFKSLKVRVGIPLFITEDIDVSEAPPVRSLLEAQKILRSFSQSISVSQVRDFPDLTILVSEICLLTFFSMLSIVDYYQRQRRPGYGGNCRTHVAIAPGT